MYSMVDYAFSIDLRDVYLHIPIAKHHHHFLWFVWQHKPFQWKVLSFVPGTGPRDFTMLSKPILFLFHHKGLCVIMYLDDNLVLTHSNHAGKRAQTFLCCLLVCLELHINFSSLNYIAHSNILF